MWPPLVKNTNGLTTSPQMAPHAPIDILPLLKDGLRFFSKYSSPVRRVTQIFLLSLPTSKITSSVQITFAQSLCSLHYFRFNCFCASVIYSFFLAFLRFIWVFLRIFRIVGQLICMPAVLEGVPRAIIGRRVSDVSACTNSRSPLTEIFGGHPGCFLLAKDLEFFLNRSKIDCTMLRTRSWSWLISERNFPALRQVTTVEHFTIECSFLVIAIIIFLIYITSNSFSCSYAYFPMWRGRNTEIRGCTITLLPRL